MTLEKALDILEKLADGIHPDTEVPLLAEDACNSRSAIRALQFAIDFIKNHQQNASETPKYNASVHISSKKQSENAAEAPENFLEELMEEADDMDLESFFAEERMFEYLQEFKNGNFNPTVARLGKSLVGTQAKSVFEYVKDFSFYGILEGITTYSKIKPLVSDFFEKYSTLIEEEYTVLNKPWEEIDFFEQEQFNTLTNAAKKQLHNTISRLPLRRNFSEITAESMLIARKVFPRAYEPWEQEENDLLLKTLRYTNNLDVLSDIFQRGQGAIRSQGQKLLYQIAQSAQFNA